MILPAAHESIRLDVDNESAVGEARRTAASVVKALGWDETASGKLALIVTEAANNMALYAGGGQLLLRVLRSADTAGVEMLALDRGPGMIDVSRCLVDGYSTNGTSGTGLGSIQRLSDVFDISSTRGKGTALLSRLWPAQSHTRSADALELGAVCVAMKGEEVCGDGFAVAHASTRHSILLIDGLGHGQGAADASLMAIGVFTKYAQMDTSELMQTLHGALRSTRGAAACIAELDSATGMLRFVGIGNCSGILLGSPRSQSLVSHNGTLGAQSVRVQHFDYRWPDDGLLVLHTDGSNTRWNLDEYPGLSRRHPSVIAGVIYRDFSRGRDDTTVVVARQARSTPSASEPS